MSLPTAKGIHPITIKMPPPTPPPPPPKKKEKKKEVILKIKASTIKLLEKYAILLQARAYIWQNAVGAVKYKQKYKKMHCLFCKFTILCPHYEIDNGSSYDNIRFDEIKVTNNNK